MPTRRLWCVGLCLVLVLAAPGCSAKISKVEGIVLLDDKPLEGASVEFIPVDESKSKAANGFTGSDGVFYLTTYTSGDGALPGEYKVVIKKADPASLSTMKGKVEDNNNPDGMKSMYGDFMKKHPPSLGGKPGAGQKPEKEKAILPAQYSDPAKTQLKALLPASGRIELKLSSKGGA